MHRYTSAELKFLKSKGGGRSLAELTKLFNKRFGLSLSTARISSVCVYYKMDFSRIHHYTAAEIRFLENKVAGRSYAELTEMFNRRFGCSLNVKCICSTLHRHNLSNGRDCRFQPGQVPANKGNYGYCPPGSEKGWFKPGSMPHNSQPVGTEVIDELGYVKIKIRNPKMWKFKHRLIWEKAHGKIPRGHVVIFADGNKLNFSLKNLLLISRSELAVMNRWDLMSANGDLTKIGKTVADIKIAIADRKRNAKKRKGARVKSSKQRTRT